MSALQPRVSGSCEGLGSVSWFLVCVVSLPCLWFVACVFFAVCGLYLVLFSSGLCGFCHRAAPWRYFLDASWVKVALKWPLLQTNKQGCGSRDAEAHMFQAIFRHGFLYTESRSPPASPVSPRTRFHSWAVSLGAKGRTNKWLWLKKKVPTWNPGKWKHGPKPAACPSWLILSHTQIPPRRFYYYYFF